MQPTEIRDGDHFAGALLHGARRWRIPVEGHVRPGLVVVDRVATKYADQMTFAEGDDVIGALPADRADHTLGKRKQFVQNAPDLSKPASGISEALAPPEPV